MRLPNFLVIGAAKSGTTTLYRYLQRHPQIYMSSVKETAFFAFEKEYKKGLEFYASFFEYTSKEQICGEASTDYTKYPLYPKTASRIAEILPNVKLIYIMRNPVDRAYAYYLHQWIRNNPKIINKSFEECLSYSEEYVNASNYMMQIKNYLQFFPKSSFLFILMEDMLQKPTETLKKTLEFLEVDSQINITNNEIIKANDRNDLYEIKLRTKLLSPFQNLPGYELLKVMLPEDSRRALYRIFIQNSPYGTKAKNNYQFPPLTDETRIKLIEKFAPLNRELGGFINRDLSYWSESIN